MYCCGVVRCCVCWVCVVWLVVVYVVGFGSRLGVGSVGWLLC